MSFGTKPQISKRLCSLLVILTLFMSMSLSACGDRQESGNPVSSAPASSAPASSEAESTTQPTTEEPTTEESTEETTSKPTDEVDIPDAHDAVTVSISKDTWYLTVVSRYRRLPNDYVPELTKLRANSSGYQYRLDSRAATHFNEMYDAAKADGVTLSVLSGFRSIDKQEQLYNDKVAKYVKQGYSKSEAREKAVQTVLIPGSSEHNLGLAVDIGSLSEKFDGSKAFNWLMKHGAEYGFILRYNKDKTDITGIRYEPWHWRYVGVEDAAKIKDSGLCLEEYLGMGSYDE